jgi:hypothetical protein
MVERRSNVPSAATTTTRAIDSVTISLQWCIAHTPLLRERAILHSGDALSKTQAPSVAVQYAILS